MNETTKPLSKSATYYRMVELSKLMRAEFNYSKNWKCEVGLRNEDQFFTSIDGVGMMTLCPPDDDLYDFDTLLNASAFLQAKGEGAIVHLYFTSGGINGELEGVHVGWVGTKDQPAVILY